MWSDFLLLFKILKKTKNKNDTIMTRENKLENIDFDLDSIEALFE